MSRLPLIALVLIPLGISAPSQNKLPSNEKIAAAVQLQKAELISPFIHPDGKKTAMRPDLRQRNCLDLVALEQTCIGRETLDFGDRVGDHWDIFSIAPRPASRSRMIDLGAHTWEDNFTIPEIEPWPALKPGERRNIIINTSGANGRDGSPGADSLPGKNGDRTYGMANGASQTRTEPKTSNPGVDYAHAPLNVQVTSTISLNGKAAKPDKFSPLTEAKLGHMYLIHVVNPNNDHYVLLHVDDLVRGDKVNISFITFRFVEN